MKMLIDTCALPRSRLETAKIYRERFGPSLGFELLMMFDLPDFERNLKSNLELFQEGLLIFHEPVWNCEPSAPKGSPVWEESMWHLRLTRKYAAILHPKAMVCHLNNQPVPPEKKDTRLRTALENLEEKREMFPDVRILVENTGTMADGSMMLDQEEFTQLCREQAWPVMIDVGHASANGWDLFRLIGDLKDQIEGFHLHNNDGRHDLHNRLGDGVINFSELIPFMNRTAPDAMRVIEYCRPELHGEPLIEDIGLLQKLSV